MSDDARAVGLVGTDDAVADLEATLRAAGLPVTRADPGVLLDEDLDVVVAVGERAVADVAANRPAVPMIPVGAGSGIRSVPLEDVDTLPQAIADGDWTTEHHVPLSVAVEGESVGTAAFDVALVTAEAARISEFEVNAGGEPLDRARADGVVVATPAGSTDYARRVHAPILAPDTGVAVAWIAPFRTDPNRWVLDARSLTITVEREEAGVDLHVDDRVVRSVGPGADVTVVGADPITVAVLENSQNRYG